MVFYCKYRYGYSFQKVFDNPLNFLVEPELNMKPLLPITLTILALMMPQSIIAAEDKVKTNTLTSYFKDIRPIFQQNCQGCHQPAKVQGSYMMIDYPSLFLKGDRDKVQIVPGDPTKSNIYQVIIAHADQKAEMPKGKDPLTKDQTELVRKWISEGAKDDSPKSAKKLVDPEHPPIYSLPPVITSIDFSPDGQILAVSGYHEIILHKADGSEILGRLVGLAEKIESLAFSPDGKQIAAAAGSPGRFGEIQIWDVAKKKLTLSAPSTFDTIYGVSWSPDGSKIAYGCADNSVRAIDATSGKQILYQGAHTDWVLGTAFSRDGLFLASISRDRSMKLTEIATQRFIDNITSITPGALKGGLQTVSVRPRKDKTMVKGAEGTDTAEKVYEELLIGGSDGIPRLYKMHRVTKRVIGDDANKVREYEAILGRIYATCFDKNGALFAAGSSLDGKGFIKIYQAEDGKVVTKIETGLTPIYSIAFTPDGTKIAAAGFDGTVKLFKVPTGEKEKEFVPVPITVSKN
jgi:WD40 repeat protein/mono/diheme cytochrome c family protein